MWINGKWAGGGEGLGGWGFLPLRSSSWAQTVRTQISLLMTYIRRRLGGRAGGVSPTRTQPLGAWTGPGIGAGSRSPQARAQPELSSTSGFTLSPNSTRAGWSCFPLPPPGPCPRSPVEADLVETLFAGLVYGVEAGARVLLLVAVWVVGEIRLGASAWGPGLERQPPTFPLEPASHLRV